MGEVSRQVSSMTSAALGSTVSSAVTALFALVGAGIGEPGLILAAVPVSAAMGQLSEDMTDVVATLWRQRRDRLQRFVDEAEASADIRMEALLREAAADPRTLEMLVRSAEVATRSLDGQKIDLLARIFVSGVRDSAKVDEALILIEALGQLEAPHLRLLTVLAKPGPRLVPGRPTEEKPRTPENMARIATWRVEDILAEDSGLSGAFDALIARLNALGLVYDEGSGRLDYEPLWFLTQLGCACAAYLSVRGSALLDSDASERP